MFKTGEKSHLCQNDETFFCSNLTSTKPEGCHMSSFICQNEVNMASESLKVEQPPLESSSEIYELVYDLYQLFPRHQNYRDGDNISFW